MAIQIPQNFAVDRSSSRHTTFTPVSGSGSRPASITRVETQPVCSARPPGRQHDGVSLGAEKARDAIRLSQLLLSSLAALENAFLGVRQEVGEEMRVRLELYQRETVEALQTSSLCMER